MSETSSQPSESSLRPSFRRRLAFRAAAVMLGLAPFLIAEAGLRLSGWTPQAPSVDPYVGFHSIKPLFERTRDGEAYVIPRYRQEFFEPEQFASTKAANEFRIFCLGGSTVQGRPYSIATSFTTWLELSLNAAEPTRRWEVVNCGGVSYASYRLAPILDECLQYEPDLFIIYTGHNEFLEDRSYSDLKDASQSAVAIHSIAANSKLYLWTLSLRTASRESRDVLPQEVDALLDYRGGLETYHRDNAWREQVVRHYGVNVRRLVAKAQNAGVPVLLVSPTANLRDCPPFKVETAPEFSAVEAQAFNRTLSQAKSLIRDQPDEATKLLESLLESDPEHAEAWFLLGHCRLATGDPSKAKDAFIRAKDADVCPLRMTEPLYQALHEAAEETKTPLIDARAHFSAEAEFQIVGDRELIDHVHPRIEGHQAIAQLLFEAMAERKLVSPMEGWQAQQKTAFREHLRANVNEAYMARGQQKLEGLRRWAAGRAFKVRD